MYVMEGMGQIESRGPLERRAAPESRRSSAMASDLLPWADPYITSLVAAHAIAGGSSESETAPAAAQVAGRSRSATIVFSRTARRAVAV